MFTRRGAVRFGAAGRTPPQSYGKCGAQALGAEKFPLIAGKIAFAKTVAFSGIHGCGTIAEALSWPLRLVRWSSSNGVGGQRMASGRSAGAKVSCEACFFHQNMLCAVSQTGACATFRPNRPEGLRPPTQLRFTFRQERRRQLVWAFPSPNEQIALHP